MRRTVLLAAAVAVFAMIAASAIQSARGILIWNRTQSAPKGLYLRTGDSIRRGDWAIVSAGAPTAIWISEHGFLAPGWPIVKRVAAVPGDEICRFGREISINGAVIAMALVADSSGRELPLWRGCITLAADEFFLLNNHPRSLDGRYFGATKAGDIDGKARLLWSVE